MHKWFIDRESKIPLYLQLTELIKYYISSGVITNNQQLPAVNDLARKLNINFNTVRKAYKEVEKEGLISVRRGSGSFVNHFDPTRVGVFSKSGTVLNPTELMKKLIRQLFLKGMTPNDVDNLLYQCLNEVSQSQDQDYLIFTECNEHQIVKISSQLQKYLKLKVLPVILSELDVVLETHNQPEGKLLAIITTGFHMNDVNNVVGERPISVFMLVTNMSTETRISLEKYRDNGRFGFICRDHSSMLFFSDLLRSELGHNIDLNCCTISNPNQMQSIINSSDVILTSPPVFQEVQRLSPSAKPVYNIFDRIDPISLNFLKETLFQASLKKQIWHRGFM